MFAEVTLPEIIADEPPVVLAGNTAPAPPAATDADKMVWKPAKEPLVEVPCQMFCSVASATLPPT